MKSKFLNGGSAAVQMRTTATDVMFEVIYGVHATLFPEISKLASC
jgi:hypothetical protein